MATNPTTTNPIATNIDDLTGTVFICDNLPFLQGVPSESVDLVCIDPPFGKQQTFEGRLPQPLTPEELDIESRLMQSWGITDPDSAYDAGLEWPDQEGTTAKFREIWQFQRHVARGWIDRVEELNPGLALLIESIRHTSSNSAAAYIAFIAQRMFQIKRILKPTGAVYLHCDYEADSHLRQMMDAIFGKDNFRTDIQWPCHNSRQRGSQHAPKSWGNTIETILFYAKSPDTPLEPWRELTPEEKLKKFPLINEKGERYYDDSAHIWRTPNMGARPNLCYTWEKQGRSFTNPHASGWRLAQDRLEEEYQKGNIVILPNGRLQRRKYERDWRGATAGNLWDDIPPLSPNGVEFVGYPTQKPQALAKRIIQASCPEGGIVLDCFAGCAYVPVAAQLTNRRWIACDMSPRAWTVIRRQFHKHPDLGIITEGEIPASPDNPELLDIAPQMLTPKLIKIRGPHDLPPPIPIEEQGFMKGVSRLNTPQYRIPPQETADQIWDAFVKEWGHACWYCGQDTPADRRTLQLDHIAPKEPDGSNDDCWNRALACSPCNSDKSNKLTPQQTIEKARAAGRIPTDARMNEQFDTFRRRTAWAKTRWQLEIKPDRPPQT